MTGRALPDPGFAGDDGSADPALAAVLADAAAGRADAYAVHEALSAARLLVPVVAVLAEEEEPDARGLRREKSTDMAVTTIVGRDGRKALPVFTSLETLAAWRPDARPVPVGARQAALAAFGEGAEALVLDVAGPVRRVVEGTALRALAEGRRYRPVADDPEVVVAVRDALAGVPGVTSVRLERPDRGAAADLRVVLSCPPDADPSAVSEGAAARLSALEILRVRLEQGLEISTTQR